MSTKRNRKSEPKAKKPSITVSAAPMKVSDSTYTATWKHHISGETITKTVRCTIPKIALFGGRVVVVGTLFQLANGQTLTDEELQKANLSGLSGEDAAAAIDRLVQMDVGYFVEVTD